MQVRAQIFAVEVPDNKNQRLMEELYAVSVYGFFYKNKEVIRRDSPIPVDGWEATDTLPLQIVNRGHIHINL